MTYIGDILNDEARVLARRDFVYPVPLVVECRVAYRRPIKARSADYISGAGAQSAPCGKPN